MTDPVENYPMPMRGEVVSYRALDMAFWRAIVIDVRDAGALDVEVGNSPPLRLRVKWWSGNPRECPRRNCTVIAMAEDRE